MHRSFDGDITVKIELSRFSGEKKMRFPSRRTMELAFKLESSNGIPSILSHYPGTAEIIKQSVITPFCLGHVIWGNDREGKNSVKEKNFPGMKNLNCSHRSSGLSSDAC